jgi:hypothetical protein
MLALLLLVVAIPAQPSYEDVCARVEKVIELNRQVARTNREHTDVKSLQFYSVKFRRAVDGEDWNAAANVWRSLKTSPLWQRSLALASDAKRRLAQRKRADDERRHRQAIMAQAAAVREQRRLINELRTQRQLIELRNQGR